MEKISSEVTYQKKTVLHIIDVNGKEIQVYEYSYSDQDGEDYDVEIDENDKELLTDEELELLEDELYDLIK